MSSQYAERTICTVPCCRRRRRKSFTLDIAQLKEQDDRSGGTIKRSYSALEITVWWLSLNYGDICFRPLLNKLKGVDCYRFSSLGRHKDLHMAQQQKRTRVQMLYGCAKSCWLSVWRLHAAARPCMEPWSFASAVKTRHPNDLQGTSEAATTIPMDASQRKKTAANLVLTCRPRRLLTTEMERGPK